MRKHGACKEKSASFMDCTNLKECSALREPATPTGRREEISLQAALSSSETADVHITDHVKDNSQKPSAKTGI